MLGAMMTVVAWVVERQLLKAIRKSGQKLKTEPELEPKAELGNQSDGAIAGSPDGRPEPL